jgi:hypothetical protein
VLQVSNPEIIHSCMIKNLGKDGRSDILPAWIVDAISKSVYQSGSHYSTTSFHMMDILICPTLGNLL